MNKKRLYTRPYVGIMKEGYRMNAFLVSKGVLTQHSLCMNAESKPVKYQYFRSATTPTLEEFPFFEEIVGPFRTTKSALLFVGPKCDGNSLCTTRRAKLLTAP